MNNLLNKFQAVTISNDNRISEKDRVYCEKQEKMYNEALTAFQQTLTLFKDIYAKYPEDRNSKHYESGYIDKYKDIRDTEDRINELKKSFIYNIVYYFQDQYNVTLESRDIQDKYREKEIVYQNVIDEIFEQLGGFNFNEKAVNELKEACRNTIYNNDKVTIKKNKLTISNYVYFWESFDGTRSLNSDTPNKIFRALSHFETEETEIAFYYTGILGQLRRGERQHDIFSKYEIGYNKVQSVKFFKNGKLEIVFETMEQALEFSKEYLEQ